MKSSEAHALFMREVQDRRQRQEFESFLHMNLSLPIIRTLHMRS